MMLHCRPSLACTVAKTPRSPHGRSILARSAPSSQQPQLSTVILQTSAAVQAQRLKEQIKKDDFKLSEAGDTLLQELKFAVQQQDAQAAQGSVLPGRWRPIGSWNNMQGTEGGKAVFSRICWGLFQPAELPVELGESVLVYDGLGGFTIELDFTAALEVGPRVQGLWQALGSAQRDPIKPAMEIVTMKGGRISPAPDADLGAWLQLFKEKNPTMKDDGCAEVLFPKPMVASREILFLDESGTLLVQMGRGSHGEVLSVLLHESECLPR